MWDDLMKNLAQYPDVVLTGIDAAGYPASLRCRPAPDAQAQVSRVSVGEGLEIQPGPASILGHFHDEKLWGLKAFLVRGVLERDERSWAFRPGTLIPAGGTSPLAAIRTMRQTRHAAKVYLAKRRLARPAIPWDKIKAAKGRP